MATEDVCYDKAKWHYDEDFPKDLPIYQGFVHTGMFMAWLAHNDLLDKELLQDSEDVKARRRTGTQIYENWDGVLASDMLTDEGNAFAMYYYNSDSLYIDDYIEILANGQESQAYYVEDNWENYDKLALRISARFDKWRNQQ